MDAPLCSICETRHYGLKHDFRKKPPVKAEVRGIRGKKAKAK